MGRGVNWFDSDNSDFRKLVEKITMGFDYGEWFVPTPKSLGGAIPTGTLAKFSSVLSNMLEVHLVEELNKVNKMFNYWPNHKWINQDPYFPDCILVPNKGYNPKTNTHGVMGIEVKIWYPMATELTARLNESQDTAGLDNSVLLIGAWMPKSLIWGEIHTLGAGVFDLLDVIRTRDRKWFKPPKELITEPNDTTSRTSNLQQTNVIFWELQSGNDIAKTIVAGWPDEDYSTDSATQTRINHLIDHPDISYRQENQNRNKIQRINFAEIDDFRQSMSEKKICGKTLKSWQEMKPATKISDEVFRALMDYPKKK